MDRFPGTRLTHPADIVRRALPLFMAAAAALLPGDKPIAAQSTADPGTSITTYTNPLNVPVADPFVLRDGETYYLYGTREHNTSAFHVYTSTDLVRWTRSGVCYQPQENSWGTQHLWAPEVVKKDDGFYLHFTAMNPHENRRNILVARSDSPLGPFKDYAGPLFDDRSVIDSHIYHDDTTGDYFVYASPEHEPPSKILGARLAPDFRSLLTTPTVCLTSEFGWEDLWIEAPIIHKHNGTLYMIYSGGAFWEAEYALGYATASSPLGPWTKADTNPFLHRHGDVEGPGHNGLAWSPDDSELFVVYHRHMGPWSIKRVVALDRLTFDAATSGPDVLRLESRHPSDDPQPLPSGVKPLRSAKSDEFSNDSLDLDQWEIFNNTANHWHVRSGQLVIEAGDADFWRHQMEGRNVLLQRLPANTGDFAVETSVTMNATRFNDQAFLTLWRDDDNYLTFASVMQTGPQLQFVTTVERFGKANAGVAPNDIGWPVCLRIEKRGEVVRVFASADGVTWQPAGRDVNIANMNFTHVGLGAWTPGTRLNTPAHFDWFRFEPLGH